MPIKAKLKTVTVKLLDSRFGHEIKIDKDGKPQVVGEFVQHHGEVIEVDPADAERMIEAEQAELVGAN